MKILAVLFPPLVVLFIRKSKMQWYLNLALTACLYIPGSIHALYVVCSREKL